jgi:hypothetical protein
MAKLSNLEKQKFIAEVVQTIEDNPEMLGDVYKALQEGLVRSIANLKEERSDFALGMAAALELTTPKVWDKNRSQLTRFVMRLADYFTGAPIEKKLRNWLEDRGEK